MKNIIKVSVLFCCFTLLFSCQKNKEKSSSSENNSTQVDEKQQAKSALKQELEIFDEEYSSYVKEFYETLNKTNAFIKEGGKEEEKRKEIIIQISENAKPNSLNIDIPKTLEGQFDSEIKSIQSIFTNFIVLQSELEKYISTNAWQEDKRKTIYNLNAKAEELTSEYERYFSALTKGVNQ